MNFENLLDRKLLNEVWFLIIEFQYFLWEFSKTIKQSNIIFIQIYQIHLQQYPFVQYFLFVQIQFKIQ